MIFFPKAKINLGLEVLSQRNDGFHEIQSCLMEVPLHDVLEIIPSDSFKFTQFGIDIPGDSSDNLCVRAFNLMKEEHGIDNVEIVLMKNIPMGAGLGGGSSDASMTIVALNDFYGLNLSVDAMEEMASHLGSDCPFFIEGGAQLATGRGEVLEKIQIDLAGCWIQIINPEIHISTKEAYSRVSIQEPSDLKKILADQNRWKDELKNSFEEHIFQKHPLLGEIKNGMYKQGAFYAAMSGSGSTLFALYKEQPKLMNKYFERIYQL